MTVYGGFKRVSHITHASMEKPPQARFITSRMGVLEFVQAVSDVGVVCELEPGFHSPEGDAVV